MALFSMAARLAVLSFLTQHVLATCFYPDGSSDSGHFPCSSGGTSVCCAEGFQCLSNGFCNDARYDNYQRVLRGGCTDKSWGSGCPPRCTSIWPQGDEGVYVCSGGKACCGRTSDCCSDSSVEKWDFGTPQVIATAGKTTAQATSAQQQDTQPTTTAGQQQSQQQAQSSPSSNTEGQQSSPTTTKAEETLSATKSKDSTASSKSDSSSSGSSKPDTTKPSSTSASGTSAVSAAVTQTPSTQIVSTGSAPNPTQNVTNNYISPAQNNTMAIAVGVGVGVGVLLFLVLLVACWYMRRKKRKPHRPGRRSRDVATEYFEIEGPLPKALTKKNPYGRGSGIVFELDGNRGIELPEKADPREMDGRGRGDNKARELDIEMRTWPLKA